MAAGLDVDGVFNRNKAIVSALSGCLHFDPKKFPIETVGGYDVVSLFSAILKESEPNDHLLKKDEIMKWVEFANYFPNEIDAWNATLVQLDEDLKQKSVLLGDGLKLSEADIIVFSALHSFASIKKAGNSEETVNTKRVVIEKKVVNDGEASVPSKGTTTAREQKKKEASEPLKQKKAAKEEKKKAPEKESAEKDAECSQYSQHTDCLLVEEIDLGDGNLRQVVSGLAKFYSPEDLINCRVVLITNVKQGKLRDVMSAGLVLCASNQDHTVVEPLIPPEGATLGERVSFSGYDGKPEDVLNPKKKQFEKITPYLCTDDKGVATFKGIPFMTSAGPCTPSIPNASVK